jgi:hypothetical protein
VYLTPCSAQTLSDRLVFGLWAEPAQHITACRAEQYRGGREERSPENDEDLLDKQHQMAVVPDDVEAGCNYQRREHEAEQKDHMSKQAKMFTASPS